MLRMAMTLHSAWRLVSCACAATAAVAGPGSRAVGGGSEPAPGVGARGRAGRRRRRAAPTGAQRGGRQLCQARLGPHPAAVAAAGGISAGLPTRWGVANNKSSSEHGSRGRSSKETTARVVTCECPMQEKRCLHAASCVLREPTQQGRIVRHAGCGSFASANATCMRVRRA